MRVLRQIPFVLLVMVASASTASTARAQGLEWRKAAPTCDARDDEIRALDFTFRIGGRGRCDVAHCRAFL